MESHPQHLPGLPRPFLMIAIRGGVFEMGGESVFNNALPVHRVEVDNFWMGQYSVTQALWMAVMGEENNPSHFKGKDRPVESVSWDTITKTFLPELNKKTASSRPPGTEYRLPTEAEWEYAARGGIHWKDEPFLFSGSDVLDEVGWYDENSHGETKPVGLKMPNLLHLYDMSGNVWEWCADWYDGNYYQHCHNQGIVKNPGGPEKGSNRVLRGGSWINYAQYCRSTLRSTYAPADRNNLIGFRLVLFFLPV